MISTNHLKYIITSQKQEFLEKKRLFPRQELSKIFKKFIPLKEIVVITGLRRCGKSSLLWLIWERLYQNKKINNDQFLFLNFEDERLAELTHHDLEKIIRAYEELSPPNYRRPVYLFFDEIQNVKYWEKWIHRIYETNKFKIFITGSNSSLLSSELSTSLTGRYVSLPLFPLSFLEFYSFFKGNQINRQSFYDYQQIKEMKKEWFLFLERGGLPEISKTNSTELTQEYFKDIIFRDIVARYNIKYKKELQELSHLLLSNLGQILSFQKISQALNLKNLSTIKNYLSYLENSFLFFKIPLFSYSYKQQVYNPDKFYVLDQAFYNKIAFRFSANRGNILENIIAVELKRRFQEIYYFKTKHNLEVDFVVKEKQKVKKLIQVCWTLEDNIKTKEREINSLLQGMDELEAKRGTIITNNDEEKEIRILNKKIQIVPAWKWLLIKK